MTIMAKKKQPNADWIFRKHQHTPNIMPKALNISLLPMPNCPAVYDKVRSTQQDIKTLQTEIEKWYSEKFLKEIRASITQKCPRVIDVSFSFHNSTKELNVLMSEFDAQEHKEICSIYLNYLGEYPFGFFDLDIDFK